MIILPSIHKENQMIQKFKTSDLPDHYREQLENRSVELYYEIIELIQDDDIAVAAFCLPNAVACVLGVHMGKYTDADSESIFNICQNFQKMLCKSYQDTKKEIPED